MKRILLLVAALLLLALLPGALTEGELRPAPEGWVNIGWIEGGISLAVPDDFEQSYILPEYADMGIVILGGDADFMLQLRRFAPETLNYAEFLAMVEAQPGAEVSVRMDGEVEIAEYRNTTPDSDSELYGVILTGLDGCLYKVSVFTGDDGAFADDAPVWTIAETLGASVHLVDFSGWGIPEQEPRQPEANRNDRNK